jgi:heat shock protein HtpX
MSSGVKTTLLLAGLSALFIAIGGALGGQAGLVIAFVLAAVMNIGSYWFSDTIVLRMYKATEVGADHPLYRVTARLAQKAGLPMPKVYVIPDMSPNALRRDGIQSMQRSRPRKAFCGCSPNPSSKA